MTTPVNSPIFSWTLNDATPRSGDFSGKVDGQNGQLSSPTVFDFLTIQAQVSASFTLIPTVGVNGIPYYYQPTFNLGTTTNYANILVGHLTSATLTGTTGTFAAGGHAVGQAGGLAVSMGATTIPLVFGQEARLENTGASTTLTAAYVHAAHMDNNQGTISHLVFYSQIMSAGENAGTITDSTDYECINLNGVTGAPATRYGYRNLDPGKISSTLGPFINSTSQEFSPAPMAGYIAGRYYFGVTPQSVTPQSLPANVAGGYPFCCAARTTFTKIGCHVTTAQAGSHVSLAIYALLNGTPIGAPIATSGSLSSAATGAVEGTISASLDAGNYLLAIMTDNSSVAVNFAVDYAASARFFGATTDTGFETLPTWGQTFGGGWLTNPTVGFSANSNQFPQVWLRP